MQKLSLRCLNENFSIWRFAPDTAIDWGRLRDVSWYSVTRTRDEISIVALESIVFGSGERQPGWAALQVVGLLALDLVGIIAKLSGALAAAGIPVFTISTYDTDYLFVKIRDVERAIRALESADCHVSRE